MKATLQFDLDDPEDRRSHELCTRAENYQGFVFNFWNDVLRKLNKHGIPENLDTTEKLRDYISDKYIEMKDEYNIKIFD